ncbi:hypothetical protein M569_04203, partial [Genlisea aurea]
RTLKMSNGEVRKVSLQDIQLVQNLIERCLQLYMSQREVVSTLLHQAKIEPGFTELVWQKLEAENPEFFRAYHVRLIVKEQITKFNRLLERQLELMGDMSKGSVILSNGSQGHHQSKLSDLQTPEIAGSSINRGNLHPTAAVTPDIFTVSTFPLPPHVQVGVDHVERFGYAENRLSAHDGYRGGNSTLGFGGNNNIGEVSISPLNGTEPKHQTVSESFLDMETNSLGFLGQIPRNFSLSDLTADFSNSADILENYSGSPFLGPDTMY